ncbi:MAG TPA: SDR family oxidoreductase [Bryobacteraceae bacterium]|nr:SDR family oxidoreductase [Bryobacteraceae bacterium]
MHQPFRLDGRTALITGASSGIGEAMARAFARAGASVLLMARDRERTQRVASQLPGSDVIPCDVGDEAGVAAAFRTIDQLDILVNNAGVGLVGNVEETSLDDFQKLLRTNVEGVFLVTRAALPLIRASRGSIINIASVAGMIGLQRRFAYCASKGAVIAMTRQLAVDYATEIRVNCICPGTVDTPFINRIIEKYHPDDKDGARAAFEQRQPMGRLGRAEEIADFAVYLASEEAGFMNGAVLPIDGGWTAG